MIKNIVIMIIVPLNERDYKRFGIEVLKKSGFNVSVFDLSLLLFSQENKGDYENLVIPIHDYFDLEKKISKIKSNTLFVTLFGLSSKTIRVIKILEKMDAMTAIYNTNVIPITFQSVSLFERLKINLKSLAPYSLIQKFYFLYATRVQKTKTPTYAILGGKKSDRFFKEDTKKIWAHTLDYDIFLETDKELKKVINEPYCLFLDNYIPHHPDIKRAGLEKNFKRMADSYYQKLNSFFDYIEKLYSLKVVIAAHPRAEYDKIGDVWNGRDIYYNQTIGLVKYSEFCMMHASTSINFPILYQKPLIFLTLDELDSIYGGIIDGFAKSVGAKKLFVEKHLDKKELNKYLELDLQKYKKYSELYIKTANTIKKNSWQIFADYLKEENVAKN